MQDCTKNSMKSKNYLKNRTLRELKKLDIDSLVYCFKVKFTMQWAKEYIRKDVCRLNSKLASTGNTQIESSWTTIAPASELELMLANTGVHKIVCISKTNQDNPNL